MHRHEVKSKYLQLEVVLQTEPRENFQCVQCFPSRVMLSGPQEDDLSCGKPPGVEEEAHCMFYIAGRR